MFSNAGSLLPKMSSALTDVKHDSHPPSQNALYGAFTDVGQDVGGRPNFLNPHKKQSLMSRYYHNGCEHVGSNRLYETCGIAANTVAMEKQKQSIITEILFIFFIFFYIF